MTESNLDLREYGAATRRILVVDDEEIVASAFQLALETLPGFEVAIATSGEQALLFFERQPFDLLVTDYDMPGMDGVALAACIRELYPRTAIVMVTASGRDTLCEQDTGASIQRILRKPVKVAQIRNTALEVLGMGSSWLDSVYPPEGNRGKT